MKRRILSLALALLMAAAAPAALAANKINLSFPTAATTGALYPLGAGIANLWNTKLDTVNARVQASNGGIQNLNLLKSKDAQVSFAVSSITYEALHGLRGFKDREYKDVRVLAGLYYNPNQVVARGEADVNALADFKGKRFAPGAAGGTTEVESRVHFTAAGLKYPDDIKAQFVGFTESIDLMRNKQLDGAWIMAGMPTAAVTEMCSTAGGKLVPINDEIIKKLQAEYPWYSKFTIPAGTYDNQKEDVQTTAVKMLLLTDASMPDDLVYSLAKSFWENLPELTKAHAVMKTVTPDMAVKDLAGIPLHPGAEKYYKEAGLLK
ncbi:TAXI family TRAP transporter solute receptor [uncultured delta proteobacterium]|uniref:TAXI family TRAP transporter solute receptor n=1 Tax=uncultured delta proteobacterium TaxID=34034 RepID=A0A212JKX4_9DELT|nr:TAXI family TRAP transporter solute receptor [uncultured delta proteobacterium]